MNAGIDPGIFPKVIVLAGPSGAGKSEISANLALKLSLDGDVALIDLDLIKPLFRLRNARSEIRRLRINFISPGGEGDTSDLPIFPAEIHRFLNSSSRLIIDVGGDGQGAKILNQFTDFLPDATSLILFVANPYRPFSRKVEDLKGQLQSLEFQTGIKVKGIVSNPHLKEQTDETIIISGHAIVEEFSREVCLPIFFLAVREDLVPFLGNFDLPLLPLKVFIRPPWDYHP